MSRDWKKAEYDRPLAEAQIIWEPVDNSELAPADVIRLGCDNDPRCISSWGSCNQDYYEASEVERGNLLMRQFVHLAAIGGIEAAAIHKAFWQIPEYRQALATHGSVDPAEA